MVAFNDLNIALAGGEHDDGNVLGTIFDLELAEDIESADGLEFEVEEDDLGQFVRLPLVTKNMLVWVMKSRASGPSRTWTTSGKIWRSRMAMRAISASFRLSSTQKADVGSKWPHSFDT